MGNKTSFRILLENLLETGDLAGK